jgi:hypothetical protein
MSTSRLPESTPDAERPPLEPVPGPVAREHVERQWFGLPARVVLLCLGCAAIGATVGLFATGNWGWGMAMLVLALILFAALTEAARQKGRLLPEQSSRIAADGRAHAATAAEVWRTRLAASVSRWRTQSQIEQLELERPVALRALGEAVHLEDKDGEQAARKRLADLDERLQALQKELDEQRTGAEERIRLARLPVQETLMVTPHEPSAPYPPPDEGNPPQPAIVPEPYPPPDEGEPPTPAPDPGAPDDGD